MNERTEMTNTEQSVSPGAEALQRLLNANEQPCRVYWGSHGCMYGRGHDGPHECRCAFNVRGNRRPRIEDDGTLNVGAPPYYGPETHFYGEDYRS